MQKTKKFCRKHPLFAFFLILFGSMAFFECAYELIVGKWNFFEFLFIFSGTLVTMSIFSYLALKITGEWSKETTIENQD